jgi:erythronate-4-phosphate dehydrogenase
MRILIDSSLPNIEQAFPAPFIITKYHKNEDVKSLLQSQDILLCRSTLKVNENLLSASSDLQYILTASSGTDHVDMDYLQLHNIRLLDAKGSNAISVADYVLSSIACLEDEGIKTSKKAGIIGLGAVGKEVLTCLTLLGYSVATYDPPRALSDTTFKSCSLEDLLNCQLLCIHAELHDGLPYPSRNLLNADFLRRLKPETVIINASRGGVVNELDLLNNPNTLIYCTDVYLNEPNVNPQVIQYAKLCTPHIAGHSIEAKTAAVIDVSQKLHQSLGLIIPTNVKYKQPALRKINNYSWIKQVLSYYDPRKESQILKRHTSDPTLYLRLRKQHNFRHDFWFYDIN